MAVRIESMSEDDIVAVASIDGPTRMSEDQLLQELTRPWARLWLARETLARETLAGETVAGDERGVAAYVVAWQVADELHVLNVATRPDRRRRGLARALVDHAVDYARSQRDRQVLLEVRRSNLSAIALYRAVGFFAMGVRARYYPDDEDAIEMVLALDPDTGAIVPHADEVRLNG
ncbi:MAG TPA: GNAT family N-acetyltransferase [Polyangiaceae bacterium]|jgi:ribosomal-protein-alanine N-acetyltransferase|nr:GNAT family N-acetyltransferase [Polyangiaceae bacterium]